LWSESFTWDGQRAEIGGGPLPGFRSNVTIKRCQTVVLDVDLNVQLFSLVVWGKRLVGNPNPNPNPDPNPNPNPKPNPNPATPCQPHVDPMSMSMFPGTLIVESRPGANVFLRSTCITIKPGGRLLAGRPSPVLTGTQSKRPPYVHSHPRTLNSNPSSLKLGPNALILTLSLAPALTLAIPQPRP
jgi:hypothetical protein